MSNQSPKFSLKQNGIHFTKTNMFTVIEDKIWFEVFVTVFVHHYVEK